jgi:hypothetical protein
LVHIGPHKTGSTAIQVAMQKASEELARHGVHYATGGKSHRPDKAGWAFGVRGRPAGTEPPPMKHWQRLVREVTDAGAVRVCISNEDFGRATREQIPELVSQLGGADVHVVAVARRLDKYLASQWQERVKAGDPRTYDAWLRVVLSDDDRSWDRKNVWFSHDTRRLVERWTETVGADRFWLILMDEGDRDLLPHAFEDLLALPTGTLKPDPARSNRGLTWAETELVRSVNEALGDGWTRPERRRYVKAGILRDMARRPAPPGVKSPPLPAWALARLRELTDERLASLGGVGVHVIGSADSQRLPADLQGVEDDPEPPQVSHEIAAAAIAAVMEVARERENARDS